MMKLKNYFALLAMAVLMPAFVACDDDDDSFVDNGGAETAVLQAAIDQFVDETVIPTYAALADRCIALQVAVEAVSTEGASADEACRLWKEARQYWEWSEAFLFGAASKYGIDPHIDTWPLDAVALNNLLNSEAMMADIENVVANLNSGLVGFHGLEYIIFREGVVRTGIPHDEARYAAAVAADLAVSACHLEAAWAGLDNISEQKQAILADAEVEPEDNFGEYMKNCGKAGSIYINVQAGVIEMIQGCRTIIDEVAHTKIGKPFSGEDESYIESPHAYNSIQDFYDNIVGVRHSYYGGMGATQPQEGSLAAYFEEQAPAKHLAVVEALNTALTAISQMKKPFVHYYTDETVEAAITAIEVLDEMMSELEDEID